MTRLYEDYLQDIAESISDILEFVKDFTFEEFEQDKKTTYAVVRAFEIIGEAAKNIPEEIRRRYSGVNWKKMANMRNRIIHEYFGIDLSIVWETIRQDIPDLRRQFDPIISDLKK